MCVCVHVSLEGGGGGKGGCGARKGSIYCGRAHSHLIPKVMVLLLHVFSSDAVSHPFCASNFPKFPEGTCP